ncbi:hypothetical protein C8Q73DRAFT_147525 [Cubamyces lactineus]|nr:hypothetical protein C8Q73DRAFT_147525 [Cubamyces lactineus]
MALLFVMPFYLHILLAIAAVLDVFHGCLAQLLFDPTILRPGGADVWTVGEVETVKWSNRGLQLPGQVGQVFLGYMNPESGDFVNYFEQPLASNVVLDNKEVNVIVPDLPTGDFYYIILAGENANQSPLFSILNPAAPHESIANVTFPPSISVSTGPPVTLSTSSPAETTATSSFSTQPQASSVMASPVGSGSCRKARNLHSSSGLYAVGLAVVVAWYI